MLGTRSRRLAGAAALAIAVLGSALAPQSATAAGLPDLMLGLGAPASVPRNSTVKFQVKLHNDGSGASKQPSVLGTLHRNFQITSVKADDPTFKCSFVNDDFVFGEIWGCGGTRGLASQGTVVVTVIAKTPSTAGSHSLQHMADPNNVEAESNEGNNQLSQPIQVQ